MPKFFKLPARIFLDFVLHSVQLLLLIKQLIMILFNMGPKFQLGMRLTSRSGNYRTILLAISLVIARRVRNHSLFYTWYWRHCKTSCWSTRYQNIYKKKLRYWKFPVSLLILVNVLVSVSTFVFTFGDGNFHYDSLILFSITNRVIFFLQIPYYIR